MATGLGGAGRDPARPGIHAGWAVHGKTAGGRDHSVLRADDDYFSRADYATILRRFGPGTPPSRAAGTGADGLPWATVSYAPLRGRRPDPAGPSVLGLAMYDWTEATDAVGRAVLGTTYLCAPFTALADGLVGYLDIYRALRWDDRVAAAVGPAAVGPIRGSSSSAGDGSGSRRPRSPDGETATPGQSAQAAGAVWLRQLPGLDVGEISQYLEAAPENFRLAAGISALLLCQPVALVGAPPADAESRVTARLRFLDSVVALLPYGQRARLAVSTWAGAGRARGIRLAFTNLPRTGDAVVRLPGRGSVARLPTTMPPPAADYYDLLVDLHEEYGVPVERLVAHLLSPPLRAPHVIADPRHALRSLRSLAGYRRTAVRWRGPRTPRREPLPRYGGARRPDR